MLSAFLDNVTTILLVVPITFLLADALDIDPVPLIVVEIVASNLGGTATLIGDPPNILIAGHTGLSFGAFIANLAPIVVVTLVVVIPGLYLATARACRSSRRRATRVLALDAAKSIEDAAEARRTVPILVLTILVFFVHKPLHLEPATVALAGAAVMLLVTRQSLHDTIASIEWLTLFFLIGLFVMVGALEETGALEEVADGDRRRSPAATGPPSCSAILWVSAIGSGARRQHPLHRGDDPGRGLARRRRRRVLVGARARRLLRRQRHDRRRGLQRRRLRDVRARRATRSASSPSCASAYLSPSSRCCCATAYVMLRYA